MKQLILAGAAIALLAGCTVVPNDANRIDSAAYVGARSSLSLDELVVAIPCERAPLGVANLHISLAGIINAKKTSLGKTDEVRAILFRSSPRIAAAIVAIVQEQSAAARDLGTLRLLVAREADRVFADDFNKWTAASDFDVQLVVTSLYLTNGSVGRSPPSGRTWWGW